MNNKSKTKKFSIVFSLTLLILLLTKGINNHILQIGINAILLSGIYISINRKYK